MPDYPNRSDLRNRPTYGDKKKIDDAKRAVPVGPPPTERGATPAAPAAPAAPVAGSMGNFLRPTQRPNEPITAGANFGAGVSALQAGIPVFGPGMQAKNEIMAIARMFPSDDLNNLLDKYGDDI